MEKLEKALTKFDLQESVFIQVETYKVLEIVDSKTEKDVRAARVHVRELRYKIQRRHKEINKDLNKKKAEVKEEATALIDRLMETEEVLDQKVKAVEAEREAKRLAKLKAEEDRKAKVHGLISGVEEIILSGMEYNTPSEKIETALQNLEDTQAKVEVELQESGATDDELLFFNGVVRKGFSSLNTALVSRKEFEEEQERLAETRRMMKEEQERIERQKAEEAARLQAERDALERQRKEQEALEAERIAKAREEAERLRAEKAALEAERQEMEARKAREAAHAEALKDHEIWLEEDRKAKEAVKMEEKRYAALYESERKKMAALSKQIDELVSQIEIPEFQIPEFEEIAQKAVISIQEAAVMLREV